MHTRSRETQRDNAMSRSLVDVQIAAKSWAAGSADGALIWQIANEFHELWHEWGIALSQPDWVTPDLVFHRLEKIAKYTDDEDVGVCIKRAKKVMSKYCDS